VNRVIGVCFALVLASASGCALFGASGGSHKPLEAAAYYPLAVGNSWTYSAKMLGDESEQTVSILKEEDGFFIGSDRTKLTIDAYGVRDDHRYLLREPLAVGKSWTNVISLDAVEHTKVLSTDEKCVVPAGEFEHCLTIESRNRLKGKEETLVNRMTFAPRVGIARISIVLELKGKEVPQTDIQLKSFKLASAKVEAK
jgi:hypothetical protein